MIDEIEARERFVERFRREFLGRYRFLILPVGTSPEPLIRTILCVEPEKVGFIYTHETADALDRIVEETGLRASQVEKAEIGGSEPGEVYEKISRWVESYDKIAVDITGGKKAMVGGATVAASFYGLDILYNDYTEFDAEKRRPVPGSEFLTTLKNPFEATQDMIYRLGVEAFNRYDYAEAERLFQEGVNRTGSPAKREEFNALLALASSYLAWDTFRFDDARKRMRRVKDLLDRFGLKMGVNRKILDEHLGIIEKLSKVNHDHYYPDVLNDSAIVKHLLLTCFTSAERKSRAGRYEDGVLRLYRVCEMAAQHRLALRGVDTGKANSRSLDHEIIERYQKIRADSLSRKYGRSFDPKRMALPDNKIGLVDGYMLLEAFEDDLLKNFELDALFNAIEVRNLAYIEHGVRVVNEKDYGRMKKEAYNVLKNFSNLQKIELESELEKYKFPMIE